MGIDIIILTKDEEPNLAYALESIESLGATVFVVDSGSKDRTQIIAREAGCVVVERPFTNQAEQLNWALENLPLIHPWTMRLDADERLTPELVRELGVALDMAPDNMAAFEMKRRYHFQGCWIRHGGIYPTWFLRIWRRGAARAEQRAMDEQMLVPHGAIGRLHNDFIDDNRKDLAYWIAKHDRYAGREAAECLADELGKSARQEIAGQAARRRWLKKNIYDRSPLYLRAFLYWFLRYFLLLGFLDGRAGLKFHVLQGFWYRFLVDAKLEELRREC